MSTGTATEYACDAIYISVCELTGIVLVSTAQSYHFKTSRPITWNGDRRCMAFARRNSLAKVEASQYFMVSCVLCAYHKIGGSCELHHECGIPFELKK